MDYLKIVLISLLSLVSMFFIAKLMGRKSISQMTLFDYTIGISIGSIAAEMATELEEPFKPLVAMIVYGVSAFLVSLITNKSITLRRIISGAPSILMKNGIIYRKNLKKAKIDLDDFLMMCRSAGYFDLTQLQIVIIEHNGKLSFLPFSDKRPANPSDLGLCPEGECLFFDVILDGSVRDRALKKSGHNEKWLLSELKKQGFKDPKEIFLGTVDDKSNLTLFRGA